MKCCPSPSCSTDGSTTRALDRRHQLPSFPTPNIPRSFSVQTSLDARRTVRSPSSRPATPVRRIFIRSLNAPAETAGFASDNLNSAWNRLAQRFRRKWCESRSTASLLSDGAWSNLIRSRLHASEVPRVRDAECAGKSPKSRKCCWVKVGSVWTTGCLCCERVSCRGVGEKYRSRNAAGYCISERWL